MIKNNHDKFLNSNYKNFFKKYKKSIEKSMLIFFFP